MLNKCTPGDWVVVRKTCIGGVAPCIDADTGETGTQVASLALNLNAENDAHMLAASKDMYAELVHLLALLDGDERRYVQEAMADARAAIAKAEGK